MNKLFKQLISAALAVLMCLTVVGCGAGTDADSEVIMDYGTGVDEMGRYNTQLYGLNGLSDPVGPDPGVFYVSEEEDPVYGGYYYRYHSSSASGAPQTEYYKDGFITSRAAYCDRSRDLYHWEPAGALAGNYALEIDQFDWCSGGFWAPEVIRNPADGKYYMYFSASCKINTGSKYLNDNPTETHRFYIGVAVSDAPVGPFDVIGDVDEETGILCPTINFRTAYDLDGHPSHIDAHPFFDDDGQLYLYMSTNPGDFGGMYQGAIGMRMESMAYPDYSTVVPVLAPGRVTVSGTPGKPWEYEGGEQYTDEGGVNEGLFMLKHNGKYYLTYSGFGYGSPSYSVRQAISDSPLGPFTKVPIDDGNPILDGGLFGDVHGTGHHSFVRAGDEVFILYHRHDSTISGIVWDRPMAADRVTFVTNSQGQEVLSTNGPSRILSWLPESVSSYQNLAQTADVGVNNGTGVKYLTDNTLTLYNASQECALNADSGDVTITLKWDNPVNVTSVMVYNSRIPDSAFSKISQMRFKLAQMPDWAKKSYDWAVVLDVPVQHGAWEEESESYLECVPAVAEFDPIWVTEIEITIKEADRLMPFDVDGNEIKNVVVSEIVVLRGDVTNE